MQGDTCTALRVGQEAALAQIKEVEEITKELSLRVDTLEFQRSLEDRHGGAQRRVQGAMFAEELVSSGYIVVSLYWVMIGFAIVTALVTADVLTPDKFLYQYMYGKDGRQTHCASAIPTEGVAPRVDPTEHDDLVATTTRNYSTVSTALASSRHIYATSAVVGQVRTDALLSSVLVLVSYGCVVLAVFVPALVVTFMPWKVEKEFEECGTLNNLCHDVTLPRGRVYTTMLFTAGFLSMASHYTHHIYGTWFYNAPRKIDTLYNAYQDRGEKILRSAWCVIPSLGFMLSALLPTPAGDDHSMLFVLTFIDIIAAPFGLLYATVMEAYQLVYGENAFAYFFCSTESASWLGPLTWVQRIRVITLCSFWIASAVFGCMQIYLSLPCFGIKIKTSYSFALWSLYVQITTLMLGQGLPAISALECMLTQIVAVNMFETAAEVETLPPPGTVIPVIGSLLESANASHRFLRPEHRANFAKQLRAGGDGLPLF